MLNPNTYIRMGYIAALSHLGVPIWAKVVPKGTKPLPTLYMLIRTQEKTPIEVSKDCWEWEVTVVLDMFRINAQGFTNTIPLDNLEGEVMTALESGIEVPNFMVKHSQFMDSIDLDFETDTQTIERRVLTYSFWLEERGPGPQPTKKNTINAMPPEAEWPTIFETGLWQQ